MEELENKLRDTNNNLFSEGIKKKIKNQLNNCVINEVVLQTKGHTFKSLYIQVIRHHPNIVEK